VEASSKERSTLRTPIIENAIRPLSFTLAVGAWTTPAGRAVEAPPAAAAGSRWRRQWESRRRGGQQANALCSSRSAENECVGITAGDGCTQGDDKDDDDGRSGYCRYHGNTTIVAVQTFLAGQSVCSKAIGKYYGD
jgi:hypothetical protein